VADTSRFRVRRLLLAITALGLLLAASCGSDSSSSGSGTTTTTAGGGSGTTAPADDDPLAPQPLATRTSVTITTPVKVEPFAPAFMADYFGEFEKENLDVSVQVLPPSDAYVALNQGSTQLHLDGLTAAFLNNKHQGSDLVWVANIHHLPAESQEGFWVRNDMLDASGKVDPAKIPGMRIALGTGGVGVAGALPVAVWLEDNGYSLRDIEPMPLGGADGLVALENGSVDASYVISPFWLQLVDNDCCTFVETWPGGFSASVYTMSQGFIDDEPEVARAIFRAIARTIDTYLQGDYHADPEVLAGLSAELGAPEESIKAGPSLVFDSNLSFDTEVVEQIQRMWIDVGDVLAYDEPLPPDVVVENQVIEDVLAGL
jgi:NitT/TauT family transport system substrate-binding protein